MPGMPEDPEALPLRRAWPFLEAHGLGEAATEIRTSRERFLSYTSTLRRGKVVDLLQTQGLLDEFISAEWPHGKTERGNRLVERYARIYQRFVAQSGDEEEAETEEEDPEETRFAYEEDLRDYLAKNLSLIEKGLTLWPVDSGGEAVEYSVDSAGRRIDILAKDASGVPVVIELKVSRGHERTVGQALYYRGRIKEVLGADRVRIIIVARDISPQLRIATIDMPEVSLYEYRLSMTLDRVPWVS